MPFEPLGEAACQIVQRAQRGSVGPMGVVECDLICRVRGLVAVGTILAMGEVRLAQQLAQPVERGAHGSSAKAAAAAASVRSICSGECARDGNHASYWEGGG